MKSIVMTLALVFSTATMAKIPATEAIKNILADGTYEGLDGSEKCLVEVSKSSDSVSVTIKTAESTDGFALLDSSSNYSVNEVTGQISATQSLNFPRYLQGGTKLLSVTPNDIDQVEFSITKILLDHRGNDASTYASCTIAL